MKVLEMGSQGYQVREWQQFLISKRLMPGGLPFGNFGPVTQKATIAFQTQQGLKPDGKVGPKTIAQAKRAGFQPIGDNVTGISSDAVDFSMKRHPQKEIQHGASAKHYTFASNIVVPYSLEQKIARIANKYFALTGRGIKINSGQRDAYRQADAMYINFKRNKSPRYGNKGAFAEIEQAYFQGGATKKSRAEVVKEMERVIQSQMDRGVYVSKHQIGLACDVDDANTPFQTFKAAALSAGAIKVNNENNHYHVEWK